MTDCEMADFDAQDGADLCERSNRLKCEMALVIQSVWFGTSVPKVRAFRAEMAIQNASFGFEFLL